MSDKTLILGIGNVLWADEGFGVRCVERLAERYSFGPEVHVLDGGTQGSTSCPSSTARGISWFSTRSITALPPAP
jgi:hydrogenase maturation protease